jgi:hypothetical protein
MRILEYTQSLELFAPSEWRLSEASTENRRTGV